MSAFRGTPGPWVAAVDGGPMVVTPQHGTPVLYASVAQGLERGKVNVAAAAQVPAMVEVLVDFVDARDGIMSGIAGRTDAVAEKARAILAALREGGAL